MGRAPDWQAAEEKPVVILGSGGMVVPALVGRLEETGQHHHLISEHDLDIAFEGRIAAILKGLWPGIVVNVMSTTDVDGAETDREAVFRRNGTGAGNVARVCRQLGALAVHVSSYHVFDGTGEGPYGPGDPTNPQSVYGASLCEGERQVAAHADHHLIVRHSWLFGPGEDTYVDQVLAAAAAGRELRAAADRFGSPTHCRHLARGLLKMANLGTTGIFHLANAGHASRFDLAREVLAAAGLEVGIQPAAALGDHGAADRPRNAALDCSAAFAVMGEELPDWREAVREYVRDREQPTGSGK